MERPRRIPVADGLVRSAGGTASRPEGLRCV